MTSVWPRSDPEAACISAYRGGDGQYAKKAVLDGDSICVDVGGPHEMDFVGDMAADVGAERLVPGAANVDASRCLAMMQGVQSSERDRAQILGDTAQRLVSPRRVRDGLLVGVRRPGRQWAELATAWGGPARQAGQ